MTIKARVRQALERRFDVRVIRERSLPRGLDRFFDVKQELPQLDMDVILDVGANTGQSAVKFASSFPEARVYSFEPGAAAFSELRRNVARYTSVKCLQLALGNMVGQGRIALGKTSDLTRLMRPSNDRPRPDDDAVEAVAVTTIDAFCASADIRRVGYLKIDTEGGDLDVLRGARGMLSRHEIALVEVEAGMNPRNSWHVPLHDLQLHLENRGYYLFGIYEQSSEREHSGSPHLRRTNPLFVSTSLF